MYYALPAIAAALLAGGTASAFGGPNNWHSDPVAAATQWEGRISQEEMQKRLQAAHQAKAKEWLQSLVTQGKISQAQADARLKFMQDNPRLGKGMIHRKMMRRMHGGEFFGQRLNSSSPQS